jgi:hypothetical protein
MEGQLCGHKNTGFHKALKIQGHRDIDRCCIQRSVKRKACRFFQGDGVLACSDSPTAGLCRYAYALREQELANILRGVE